MNAHRGQRLVHHGDVVEHYEPHPYIEIGQVGEPRVVQTRRVISRAAHHRGRMTKAVSVEEKKSQPVVTAYKLFPKRNLEYVTVKLLVRSQWITALVDKDRQAEDRSHAGGLREKGNLLFELSRQEA